MLTETMGLLVSMLILFFAIGTILAGAFTIYFGSGKSRAIGSIIFLVGIIVAVIFYNYGADTPMWGEALYGWETVKNGIAAIIGGIIGVLVGLGLFLAGIIKA